MSGDENTRLYRPGQIVPLPEETDDPGHDPLGYVVIMVCSCGSQHGTVPVSS